MSALATIVGSLGELSESELRQLYLMVGVRLGIPDVPAGAKPREPGGGKTSNAKKGRPGKSGGVPSSSKGNPQRKSQWANHPLYQEYSRLKKVVEAQAKEQRCSFNAVNTAESRAYAQAFTHWVEAKSSFRGHGESGQIREPAAVDASQRQPEPDRREETEPEDSSDEEGAAETAPTSAPIESKTRSPPPKPTETGKSRTSPTPGPSGNARGTPGKGKGPAK